MDVGLRTKPWKILSLDNGRQFLIKTNFDESGYDVLISDKAVMWRERLTDTEIERRLQKLNPGVEAPLNKILDHLRDNCEDLDRRSKSMKVTVDMTDVVDSKQQKLVLMMRTELAGLPFIWRFITLPADSYLISVHLITPLLTMSAELLREQEELYKQLYNKDKEIEDMRAQGIKVTRKRLETAKFDEATFKQEMIRSKGFEHEVKTEGQSALKDHGHQLYREVMLKQATLHNTDIIDRGVSSCADGSVAVMDVSSPGTQLTCGEGSSSEPSPQKSAAGSGTSPTKDVEEIRKQELEHRLAEEMEKKEQKRKKKKLKL